MEDIGFFTCSHIKYCRKKWILYLQNFSTDLMVVGSDLQISFLEHRLLEEKASSFGRSDTLKCILVWGMCSHDSLSLRLFWSLLTLSSYTYSSPSLSM